MPNCCELHCASKTLFGVPKEDEIWKDALGIELKKVLERAPHTLKNVML